jgi:glycosyltransferase involved in cell wall biosynthesis
VSDLREQYEPELQIQSNRTVISLFPFHLAENRFIDMFSQAISEQGIVVREFRWRGLGLQKTDFILLHWPDEFFVKRGSFGYPKSLAKLVVLQIAKMLWGAKLVWVAHNAAPHDGPPLGSLVRRWFLRSLDGVIFLSHYSRRFILELYPEIRTNDLLVTVHAHYRGTAINGETPCRKPRGEINLLQFGQIRPYKNIEALVEAVSSTPSGVHLLVAGMVMDRALSRSIEARAQLAPNVTLDFRDSPISEAELEAIVDAADAVVLPYKNILNSGSALFSLSRNRPVLGPNMGSLPELRNSIGSEWVYLYDHEFSRQVLLDFKEWILNTDRGSVAPLDTYDWSRVGLELRSFIGSMSGQAASSLASE